MSIRKIAVLGAGNGGCAAAADLTLRGYEVSLYSRSSSTLRPIQDRGGIELVEDGRNALARPERVTGDLKEAVDGAGLIIIATPAVAHANLAAGLAPYLKDGQRLLLNPGHTGGSLHLAAVLGRAGCRARVGVGETATLTYICRLTAPAKVEIYRRTARLRCAAFPGRLTADLVGEIRQIYPGVVPARHVLETGLANINAMMHPAGMLANAGWIEKTGGDFLYYREGITPAVAEIIAAVDRERLEIAAAVGLEPNGFVEIFFQAGLTSEAARASGSVYRAIHESAPNRSIKAPPTLDHRYLSEDVGYGLVPMAEIGRLTGVETPVIGALITLASNISRMDYRAEGLTLAKMGLDGIDGSTLPSILQEGFRLA